MKVLRNEKSVARAFRLMEIIVMRRDLEKEEKFLKKYFKAEMHEARTLKAGEILLTLSAKSRTLISKDLVIEKFGMEGLKEVEQTIEYEQMDVYLDKNIEENV